MDIPITIWQMLLMLHLISYVLFNLSIPNEHQNFRKYQIDINFLQYSLSISYVTLALLIFFKLLYFWKFWMMNT